VPRCRGRTSLKPTGCEVFELYLHCPNCRLTVYNPSTVLAPERCPRCGARFDTHPQRFFRRHREEPRPMQTASDDERVG